jgi:CBS domain-containing protein
MAADVSGKGHVAGLIEEEVVRVDPDASLEGVADLLAAGQIGALIIGEGTSVSAIISERDLVHAVARRMDLRETRATDIANSQLIWCDASATIAEAAAKMMEYYVRHVLVEENGRFVGIVSARDLLGAFAAAALDLE